MTRKTISLAATALACLMLAGCVSEGGDYSRHDRVYRPASPGYDYRDRRDERHWQRERHERVRDDRRDRRDWRDDNRRDGRFEFHDGRRVWVPYRG